MSESMNAFTVYASMELKTNEFFQQLNHASQLLNSTLNNMSGEINSINISPVKINTEANTSAVQDVESAISGINEPTVTIHTETEPVEQVTVPPADDKNFIQKIKESFSNLKNNINSVPSDIAGKFKEMGTNIVNNIKSFPANFSAKFNEAKSNAIEKIKSIPSGIAEIVTSIPSKISTGLKNIGENISNAFKSGVENAKNALKEIPEKASEMLKETGEKLQNIAETVAKSVTVAISAVSAETVAFGKSAVETGANFDTSISQVAATMGKTVDEISELRDFALEMGSSTAFSATDSANALNYMALAGYDAETAMSMLPNVLNLAAAGGMELATASDMITDSQSALGLSIEETTELVDKMAKASSSSNTSVSQLGDAILTIGGTAKKLKGGTTELTTVLGILADNGIKGSEGGTALRNMLNSLISPTEDATAMLEEMGTSLYDSEGNMRSLNDVFLDLKSGMDSLSTQAEKDQVLTTIFNSRDLKSAEALIANVGDRFSELSAKIEDSASASEAMANTQLDNLTGDITLFQSALEGAKIAVSDHLTPALRDFVTMGSEAMSEITMAFSNSENFEEAIFKVGRYLQKYIYQFIEKISDAIPKIISVAMTLINSFGQAIMKNIPKIVDSATELIKDFAENIAKNAPTVIKEFSEMLKNISEWLKTNGKILISSGMEIIKSISAGISENLPTIIETITEIITFIATEIGENANILLESGLDIIFALGKGIFENISELADAALDIVTSLGGYIIEKIPLLLEKAPEIVASLANALGECGTKMVTAADELITKFTEAIGVNQSWQEVKDSFSGAVDEIVESFTNLKNSFDTKEIENAKNFFIDLKNTFLGVDGKIGLLQHTIGFLLEVLATTVKYIGKIISATVNLIAAIENINKKFVGFKTTISSVLAIVAALVLSFTTAPAAIGVAVGLAIASVVNAVKLIVENFDELKEFFPLLWENIKNGLTEFGDAVGGAIYDFIQEKKAAIKQFFTDIGDNIGGWIYDRVQEIKDFFGNISDGAKIIVENISEFISEIVDNWHTGIQSIQNFFTNLKEHIHNIFSAIKRFISELVDNWKSGVNSIKNGIKSIVEKVKNIPEAFVELVENAFSWGSDLIENFMQGAKEKLDKWNDFWEDVGFTIYDLLHHSTPEKGPLKDDDKWGGDLMENLITGVESKEKTLSEKIKNIAENIKKTFENSISLNTDITANENLNSLKFTDIPAISENINTVKSDDFYNEEKENSVNVENLNIYIEGTNLNSEYEMEKFINMIATRLNAREIRKSRGIGGVMS